jgi:hypothetical protein
MRLSSRSCEIHNPCNLIHSPKVRATVSLSDPEIGRQNYPSDILKGRKDRVCLLGIGDSDDEHHQHYQEQMRCRLTNLPHVERSQRILCQVARTQWRPEARETRAKTTSTGAAFRADLEEGGPTTPPLTCGVGAWE